MRVCERQHAAGSVISVCYFVTLLVKADSGKGKLTRKKKGSVSAVDGQQRKSMDKLKKVFSVKGKDEESDDGKVKVGELW